MPAHAEVIDIEAVLVAALKADAGLTAIVAGKVSTQLPPSFPSTGEKRVQLFRVGGSPDADDRAGHLDRPSVQLNAFGASREEAFDVAKATMAALFAIEGTTVDDVVVSRVLRNLGPTWSQDPETNAPRYLLGVILYAHPAPV